MPAEKSVLKEHSTFLGNRLIFQSPRIKKFSFTVFESIQPISGSGGSTFSLAQHRSLNLIRPLASRLKMTKEFRYFSYLKLDTSVVTSCTKTDGKCTHGTAAKFLDYYAGMEYSSQPQPRKSQLFIFRRSQYTM